MKFWQIKNISEDEKEICLYGNIVDERPWWSGEEDTYITPGAFLDEVEKLKNVSKLTIRLNSGGGDVFVAMGIYNQLKSLKATKTVIIDGICASAATIIASAGDIVHIPKSALFMIHNPTVFAFQDCDVETLTKLTNVLTAVKQSIIEVYKAKTNLSDEELSEMMDQETWFSGEKAVENGFCDELLTYEVTIQNNGEYLFVNSVNCGNVDRFKNLPSDFKIVNGAMPEPPNLTPKGVEDKSKPENKGGNTKIMDLEELKQQHPDLFNQIKNEGREEGILAERERFKDLDEIGNVVDQTLLFKAKYEEPKDAATLSLEAMKLENKQKNDYKKDSQDDYNNSGVDGIGVPGTSPSNDESKAKKSQGVSNVVDFMNNDKRRVK